MQTMRKRILISLISGLFISGVGVQFANAQTEKTSIDKASKTVSKKKMKSQKMVLQSGIDMQWMDSSVRPQDDFFRYMSGKWLDTAQIPADRGRYGSFDQLSEMSAKRSADIIKELAEKNDLKVGSNQQKIADVYKSFMDEARLEELDIKPLAADLARIAQIKDKADLAPTLVHLARMGVSGFIGAGVTQDAKDSSKYTVGVGQSGLSLPDRDYYLKLDNPKFKAVREAYIVHV